jgi:hypothetical protein
MKRRYWEAVIPQKLKNKFVKKCYRVWTRVNWSDSSKVFWLTDAQVTFYKIKYPKKTFIEILDKDTQELYKQYLNNKIE